MNKNQKEVEKAKLADEKKVLDTLRKQYEQAAADVQNKINFHSGRIDFMLNEWDDIDEAQQSIIQSQIYQRKFQQQLKAQLDDIIDKMDSGMFETVQEYLDKCYLTGLIGTAYDLHGQGIPVVSPIDQKAMLNAVTLDPKLSEKLYGDYMGEMKQAIRGEISRGIATADSFTNIARNISNKTNVGLNKTMRIVRTEGHRIQIEGAVEMQDKAKKAGADVLKQWDATLDGKTRESHRRVDGELRELNEKFSNGLMHPSDSSGGAAEVVNCRCALLQRARWALDDDELETLKQRAETHGLYAKDPDGLLEKKEMDFKEFQKKFLKAGEEITTKEALELATNVQELNDALKKRTGCENVDVSGIDFELAKENAIQWAALHDEYRNDTIEITVSKLNAAKAQVERFGTDRSCIMSMDKATFSDKEKYLRKYKRDVEDGWHVGGIPENQYSVAITTHEFAHALSFSAQGYDQEFWKEIKNIKKKYASKLTNIDKRYFVLDELTFEEAQAEKAKYFISNYAPKNADEFLAEAFTMAKLSETPSPYAMEVLEVVDKYFKRTNDTNVVKAIAKKNNDVIISSKAKAKKTLDGVIEAYSKQTDKALQSGIRSELKQIEKHLDKIEHPEKYVTDWETRNEYYKQGLLDKWRKEIDNFKLQVKLREDELARRNKR